MERIRWKYEHCAIVGKAAALFMYRGLKDITAYRAAQEKLDPDLHRTLKAVNEVPSTARKIAKEELERLNAEAKLLDPETVNQNGKVAVPVTVIEQMERLIAINQTLVSTVHSLSTRVSELENTITDLMAELGSDKQPKEKEIIKRKPRIAVIGVMNDQARIIERDFPHVALTCQTSGLARYDATICTTHDAVIVTQWSRSVWDQFKKYENACYVAGGMSSIKAQIKAAAKGFV